MSDHLLLDLRDNIIYIFAPLTIETFTMEPELPNHELHYIHDHENHCAITVKFWMIHCCLCTTQQLQGKSTKHRPWHCRNYPTPQKARKRLCELDRCMECGESCYQYHDRVNHKCQTHLIEEYNYAACRMCGSDKHTHQTCPNPQPIVKNQIVRFCKNCGSNKHAFWTCDEKPHPGSQFKTSNASSEPKDHQNSKNKLTSAAQNPKASNPSIIKENPETVKVESPNIPNKPNYEHEICKTMKDEFKSVNLKIAAMQSNLNEKIELLKSTMKREESLESENELDKNNEKDKIIKEQKLKIKNLKKSLYDKNEELKEVTSDLNSKITKFEKDLGDKVDLDTLENLRKQNEALEENCKQYVTEMQSLRESNKQYCTEMGNFQQKYEKENKKLWNFICITFPNARKAYSLKPWNQDEATFIVSLETKLISSGCESTACQGKIQETITTKDKEISTLRYDCSKLEADRAAHFESLQHQISRHEEIILQKDKVIESLQSQFKGQQYESPQEEPIICQEESKNLSSNNVKSEETAEYKDLEINQGNNFKIISSAIEKILLEISNDRKRAAEHRKNINEKLITYGNDSARYMQRKLIRYRGERASQIASFEERIKRDISNMMSWTSNEEMRILERRHRHEKNDIIQRLNNLEDSNQKDIQIMTENINKLNDSNRELKEQLKEKERDISQLEKLFKQKLDSVTLEIQKKDKDALNHLLSSNIYDKIHAPAQVFSNTPDLSKVDNIKIPQGSNKSENSNKKHPEGDNYDKNILHSMMSNSPKVPKYSSISRMLLNEEKADLQKLFIKSYRFAINMEDKILLYDKDPRLRTHLGSNIKLSNKFGCLENNKYHEREI